METEKTVKYSEDFHGVRFDAQARSTKRWASVEMQTYRDYLGFWARSYHANMDLKALDAGSDYKMLPRSFVIFICRYNIGKGEGREEGEDRLNRLYMLLIEQSRMDDLKKATEDEAFRKQLYQEFGLDE